MLNIQEVFRAVERVPDFSGHTINSVHYRNGYNDTPLHIVSCWGDCEAIQLLIEAGADINAKGETGYTPLHCATEQGKPDAIKLLLSLGAKFLEDDRGDIPLTMALSMGVPDVIEAFENY